jgi:hypothetical protein
MIILETAIQNFVISIKNADFKENYMMTKQIFVLSIVLLASIIINVSFVFDKIAVVKKLPNEPISKKVVSKSDLTGEFIVQLLALKNLAVEEGAQKTAKAAETFIIKNQSQFENYEQIH